MLNYGMRMNQILNNPSIIVRCTDLGAFLEVSTVDELKSYFQTTVDSIFGFPSHTGWGIRRLTRTAQPKETDAVVKLLAPDGPVFKAIYRLMSDRNFRLEYPLNSLPPVLERRITRLDISEFFSKKVHLAYDAFGQVAASRNLVLNPFEYYFFLFTFANLGIGVNQNYLMGWGSLNDTAYTILLEEYNNYFFPCDGRSVPPISTQGRPQTEATFNTDPVAQTTPRNTITSPSRMDSPHPTLFKASVFQESPAVPAAALEASFSSAPHSYLELWRSETVLSVIMEMWMSVDCNDTVSSIFLSSLPNVDLVKCVRMVVRHQHFFSNCVNQQALHPMEGLKRSVLPLYQRKLYSFLRHLFTRWPLDNTFRIVYETWLSYIQPWRYSKLDRFRQFRDKEVAQIEPIWYGFLVDNILFYTTLFQLLLPRYLRSDLTSFKNALMVFRVSKVLKTQENLKIVLANIEKLVIRYILNQEEHSQNSVLSSVGNVDTMNLMEYFTSSRLTNIKQMLSELEPPGFVYSPLFSDSTRKQIQTLVFGINQAMQILKDSCDDATSSPKATNAFMKMLGAGDVPWQTERPDSPVGPHDNARTLQLLDYSKQQLIFLFELHEVDGIDSDQRCDWGDSFSNGKVTNEDEDMELTPGKFSPSIASAIIPRGILTPSMMTPRENPDLACVRQHEIASLVNILRAISTSLNKQFGGVISRTYYEKSLNGKFARALFSPPLIYEVIEKPAPGRQIRCRRYLPPRVNLRPLASATFIVCLFIILPFLRLLLKLSPTSIVFMLLVMFCLKVGLQIVVESRNTVQRLRRTFGPFIDLDDNDNDLD